MGPRNLGLSGRAAILARRGRLLRHPSYRQPDPRASGANAPFFMGQHDHYIQERTLQQGFTAELEQSMPAVRVLDVELDMPQETVRLFVDCDGGVTHEICRDVTRAVRDVCPDYALEVSSPGIEPPLRTEQHIQAAIGAVVRVRARGARRSFKALLLSVDSAGIRIRREDGSEHEFAHADIARMHRLADTDTVGGFEPHDDGVRSSL